MKTQSAVPQTTRLLKRSVLIGENGPFQYTHRPHTSPDSEVARFQ